jgi:hypothetical protein
VEDYNIPDLFFEGYSKLFVGFSLCLPDDIEFIKIILSVEYLFLQARMGIFFNLTPKVLSNSLPVEKELLASVAN